MVSSENIFVDAVCFLKVLSDKCLNYHRRPRREVHEVGDGQQKCYHHGRAHADLDVQQHCGAARAINPARRAGVAWERPRGGGRASPPSREPIIATTVAIVSAMPALPSGKPFWAILAVAVALFRQLLMALHMKMTTNITRPTAWQICAAPIAQPQVVYG